MQILVFLGTLAILLPLGIPIAFVLIMCSVMLMISMGIFDTSIISQNIVMGTNNFSLMAIPFFMLAGELMSKGGLSIRIVNFCNVLIGRINGGLGYAAVLASIIFAGLSGSAVADAAALGGILIPLMVANGYDKSRSTGLICSGSVIAPIIPPSIPMIVLATAVGQSVGRMFMAGIVPGIMLGIALMFTWKFIVKKDGYTDKRTYSRDEAVVIIRESIPALIMPVIIVGGIRLGIVTPTEAGSFAAIYALIISFFVYKELKFKDLIDVFVESAKSTGIVMFIVAAATGVGWIITVAQIPQNLIKLMEPLIAHPTLLLVTLNIFFFIMGMIMDLTPNLLIFGPIVYPVIIAAGIDPIYFGVIMVLNLTIGLITPPVGTILYIGSSVGDIKFPEVVRGVMPFLIVEITMLMLFIFIPQLILVPLSWFV
jgi:tripartite ATP-independent transporter DctM subunit